MLTVTRDMVLPTTVTGSYPRPLWFDRSLAGRSFKAALGDSLFREQYLDAVASIIAEQEAAGLDIVTDGDSRFDLTVGGKSWFFYPIERLGAICAPAIASMLLLQLNCDVLTIECASSDGQDLKLFKHIKTDKKIGIGVVNHCNTVVEPAEHVAALIRKALEYIPKEQLIISTDCGFGREGLSRRIAFYTCVALVEGTNIVRRELGLPEARVRAADPKLWFAGQ